MEAMHYQHDTNLTYGMHAGTTAGVAQGRDLDLAHIMQSYIIYIHEDVSLYVSLIPPNVSVDH